MKKLIPSLIICLSMVVFMFTGCFREEDNSMSTLPELSHDNSVNDGSTPREDSSTNSQSGSTSSNVDEGIGGVDREDDSMSNSASDSMSGSDNTTSSTSQSGSASSSSEENTNSTNNENGANDGANSTSGSMSGSTSSSSSSSVSQSAAPAMAAGFNFLQADAVPVFAGMTDNWNLTLVNAQNPLNEGFAVNLQSVEGYDDRLFDVRAITELEALLSAAQKADMGLYLVSAYRTPERQAALFEKKTTSFENEGFDRQEAERQAAQWVARPYTSEHNLGLAVDLVSANWYENNSDLTAEFENTAHFEWLYENCANYGFILRYPKGKESITGVTYEPWHFRYVGVEHAKVIMDNDLTLEEYLSKY